MACHCYGQQTLTGAEAGWQRNGAEPSPVVGRRLSSMCVDSSGGTTTTCLQQHYIPGGGFETPPFPSTRRPCGVVGYTVQADTDLQ